MNRKIKRVKYKENNNNHNKENKNNNNTALNRENQEDPETLNRRKIAENDYLINLLNNSLKDITNFNLPFNYFQSIQNSFSNLRITYLNDIIIFKDNFIFDITDDECLKMYLK